MVDQAGARTPLEAMARVWPVVVLCALIGGGLGVGAALARPTTYTASARLAVGGSSLAAQAVPGFADASKQLASNYARFVETEPVVAALSPSDRGAVHTVSASPVPDSNVVLLEATASTEGAATRAAQAGATQLRAEVADATAGTSPEDALALYTDVSTQVAQAQQRQVSAQAAYDQLRSRVGTVDAPSQTQLDRASSAVAQASSALAVLQVQQNALGTKYQDAVNAPASQSQLEIVQPGTPEFNDRRSKAERYGLAGLVLGLLVAALLAVRLDRRAARRLAADDRAPADPRPASSSGASVTTPAR